jgi:hypothetical protein
MPRPVRQTAQNAKPKVEDEAKPKVEEGFRKITNVGDKAGCYTLMHTDGTLFPRNATVEHRDDAWVKAQVERGIMAYA